MCIRDSCSGYFGENAVPASKPPETVSIKLRADRHETEEFYLSVSTNIGVCVCVCRRIVCERVYARNHICVRIFPKLVCIIQATNYLSM